MLHVLMDAVGAVVIISQQYFISLSLLAELNDTLNHMNMARSLSWDLNRLQILFQTPRPRYGTS